MQFPGAAQGGIAKLAMGGRASNMPMQSIEETTAEEDIENTVSDVAEEIDEGLPEFVDGCTDETACNYDEHFL